MKAKPIIYLHIGHVKTGTSAIQHFIFANMPRLVKSGLLYPQVGLYGPGQHKIPINLLHKSEIADILRPQEKKNYTSIFYESNLWEELHQEIANAACPQVFISSEYFIFMQDLSQLKKELAPYNVKVILTLRRQDLLFESFYRQVLQVGWSKNITAFINKYRYILGDYRAIIERWAVAFGAQAMIVKDYSLWKDDGAIYKDFLSLFDLPAAELLADYDYKERINISMDVGYANLLRIINRQPLPGNFKENAPRYLQALQDKYGRGFLGEGTFITTQEVQALKDTFYDSNRWVEENYLSDRPSSLSSNSGSPGDALSGFKFRNAAKILFEALRMHQRSGQIESQ